MSLNKRIISGKKPLGPAGFRALTFTGNGGTQTVTGMGFQPDIVWIKDRDTSYQLFWLLNYLFQFLLCHIQKINYFFQ